MAHAKTQVNSEFKTLVDCLQFRTHDQPKRRAYTCLTDGITVGSYLTYQALSEQVRALATLLQNEKAAQERALLLYPPGLEYVAAFLGCLFAGVVAVPAYPPDPARLNRTLPRLLAIIADSQAQFVLTTTPVMAMVGLLIDQAPELKALRWLTTDNLDAALADKWCEPAIDEHTLAFLQYTSGSTSAPKGVMLTHQNLLHNLAHIQHCFDLTAQSRAVIWLPPYHDMGLIGGILEPLYTGFPVMLMSPIDFLKRPFHWLQAISQHKVTVSGGPNFAYDLCVRKITPEERAALDLSHWELAFNGAEPVRADTLRRFAKTFAPCGFRLEAFYPCYGLAEGTLLVSGGKKQVPPVIPACQQDRANQNEAFKTTSAPQPNGELVSCGHSLPDQQVVIVHPATRRLCSPGQVGEIWVSGPSVAGGYWGSTAETASTFQAYTADTRNGPFLRTGDLGFLQAGELFVTGRMKDLIIIRGRNHYPQDIEFTVEKSHPALRPGCTAAFAVTVADEERLIVAQEVDGRQATDTGAIIEAIRQAVAAQHQLQVYAVLLLAPRTIPKTSSGKIQRHACQADYEAGNLDIVVKAVLEETTPVASMPPVSDSPSFIRRALTAVADKSARQSLLLVYLQEQAGALLGLPPEQLRPERALSIMGLDSLTAVELQHHIETDLQVALFTAELLQDSSLQDLAAHLLARLEAPGSQVPPLLVAAGDQKPTIYPLSHNQKAMWFLQQLAPGNTAYTIAQAVRIHSSLEIPALQNSLHALAARHAALRTTFPVQNGQPMQHVAAEPAIDFDLVEASSWSELMITDYLRQVTRTPFDLAQGPLLRIRLLTLEPPETILFLSIHHIIADFWSLTVLVRELGVLYEAAVADTAPTLPALSLDYVDFTRWQAELLAGAESERLWQYWNQQLAGVTTVLNLPTDFPRPAGQTFHGASQMLMLDGELSKQITELGRTHGATLYMVLLAGYQLLLHRCTGQNDILVGSPTAGRARAGFADLVGCFMNPLALRADLSGNPAFNAFLAQVKTTVLAAFAHQDLPFNLLVERLQPSRDPSRSPLFQAMFVLQKAPALVDHALAALALGGRDVHFDLGRLSLQAMGLLPEASPVDLTLSAAEMAAGIHLCLQYNSDLFTAATAQRFLLHYEALLRAIVAEPSSRISNLAFLTARERQQLLYTWNNTQRTYAIQNLLQLFENSLAHYPDAVAIVFEEQYLTYHELECRANQLAHYLRDQGIGTEDVVGICLDRSLELILGLLAILKVGAAYLPLDPTYPVKRLAFILQDSQASLVLTQQNSTGAAVMPLVQANSQCPIIDLTTAWPLIQQKSTWPLPNELAAENLAYVIYTSGSTGQPKGVQVTHGAVANFMQTIQQRPGITAEDRLLALTTLSFDIAALEIFLPLTVGATVVLATSEVRVDGRQLAALIYSSEATIVQATPTTWQLLLAAGWRGTPRLKLLCGGEALPFSLAEQLLACGRTLWNLYGPTEVTIWSTLDKLEAAALEITIGRPMANTQIYLLDQYLQLVATGMPGMLYIGGAGLARGYFQRPGLTAASFIPNPFSDEAGSRLYCTGDLVRYLPDGRLEFLGRRDHQVKIRGFRIEPGEIEEVLRQHAAIAQAVVVVRAPVPENKRDKRLVAYLLPQPGATLSHPDLHHFLHLRLPHYMVPEALVILDKLPLTPNGKIDRQALPAPPQLRPQLEVTYVRPQTGYEQRIAAVWQEFLQIEAIGIHDNFFELGGHSLMMAHIQTRLQEWEGCQTLSVVELFQYPTISSLARHLSDQQETLSQQFSQGRADTRTARQTMMRHQRQQRRQSRLYHDS